MFDLYNIFWYICFICIFFSKIYYKNFVTVWEFYTVFRCNFRAILDWYGLFFHPFSHTCNIGHINYRLQFIYHNRTYNIWTSTQYNAINNNKKSKDQLEVKFVTTSRYMCIYLLYVVKIFLNLCVSFSVSTTESWLDPPGYL